LSQVRVTKRDLFAPVEHSQQEKAVKGRTTFDELINWGLTQGEIEEILGLPMGPHGSTVRDFVTSRGMEFSGYKARLQELLESKSIE
jgi:hypothetical protein